MFYHQVNVNANVNSETQNGYINDSATDHEHDNDASYICEPNERGSGAINESNESNESNDDERGKGIDTNQLQQSKQHPTNEMELELENAHLANINSSNVETCAVDGVTRSRADHDPMHVYDVDISIDDIEAFGGILTVNDATLGGSSNVGENSDVNDSNQIVYTIHKGTNQGNAQGFID